jgi:fatty-acyl-CoA synthase
MRAFLTMDGRSRDMECLTIGDFFDRIALGVGEHEALVFPDQRVRWGYRETYARVTQLAKGLMGLGIDMGEHVAVLATNRSEWVLLQLATAKIGAVLVPIDPASGARELADILAHSDAAALFVTDRADDVSFLDVLIECCPEVRNARPGRLASRRFPLLKRVALLGDGADAGFPGVLTWPDVLTAGAGITDHLLRRRQNAIEPADVVSIHYITGTTDSPRGVELTHLNQVSNAIAVGDCMRLGRRDRLCVPVPFFQPFGCVLGTLTTFGRGATMVVPAEHFDAGKTLAAVGEERCTALYGEPRMLGSALRHPHVIRVDLSSLRTGVVMGACPVGFMPEIVERLHLREVTVAYGRTEATAVITQTRTEDSLDIKTTTVGRALPDVEVKIVHPKTGIEVPLGSEGELCCRGALVMRGYYKMPEATAATIGGNGWLRTGDLAVVDQYGYCAITGRVHQPPRAAT